AEELADRPRVVVGNKCDMPGVGDASGVLAARCDESGVEYFAVSALTGEGIDPMLRSIAARVYDLRRVEARSEERFEAEWVHTVRDDRTFEVRRFGDGWVVEGRGVERMVIMTEMDNEEALAFLQKRLVKAGVERALEEAGAFDGDEIIIAGRAFEFSSALARDPEVAYIEDEVFAADDEREDVEST
ncbi:MAG: Obg family GTPase CgtA, partial [Actinomycetota bacterium]|nr:Obg family GTPase CgtA [Actinomycetota bacterium]